MILGRASDCDLKIASSLPEADTVSPHHARIIKRDARWIVVDGLTDDQPSLNGIYVNGKRTLENYLDEDDELAFGALQFRFHVPPAAHSTLQGDA
jgi:pSer/pThr/pTyr-binding forkhead associated (FHA) protein